MKIQSLTNFNVPITTRTRFDQICELSGRTRTSVLIELMERHIIEQGKVLEFQNRQFEWIDEIITRFHPFERSAGYSGPSDTLTGIGRQNRLKGEFDLPDPLLSDGGEEW